METRSPRLLATACAGLVGSAALLWGGSAAVWYRVSVPDAAVTGRAAVEFTGAQVAPSLTGMALLALAGVAAVVATGGLLRRLVGVLLALAGAGVAAIAAWALVDSPFATDAADVTLPRPPAGVSVDALRHAPTDTTAAPLLAVAGGVVLLAVGLLAALREKRLPRFGARYANPAQRRVDPDPDRAAWQALDAGVDPTANGPEDRGDDPGDGPRERRV
jgi:uncharacterized membrane protein (TIGR02234 family)